MDNLGFKQWLLQEMPITSFQTIGKWGPNDRPRGYNKQDIGILTNPKAIEKIHKQWSNTKENFEFYFLRAPKAAEYLEQGEVTPEWVKEKLGIDIQPKENAITIIFTNNRASEKIPMTAWTIAHRMGHTMDRSSFNRNSVFKGEFNREVERDFSNIVKQMFPKQQPYTSSADAAGYNYYGVPQPRQQNNTIQPLHIARMVGTMKSVRDGNLRMLNGWNEFVYELTAQYIINGKIKFNPLTKAVMLRNRMAWGRPNPDMKYSGIDNEELTGINDSLQDMAEKYEYILDDVFQALLGKIFVM